MLAWVMNLGFAGSGAVSSAPEFSESRGTMYFVRRVLIAASLGGLLATLSEFRLAA